MINDILMDTLTPVISNVYPDVYTGQDTEYMTFSYDIQPKLSADNDAWVLDYMVTLQYFAPLKKNVLDKRIAILNAIRYMEGAGLPSETNVTDKDGQHYYYTFVYSEYPEGE